MWSAHSWRLCPWENGYFYTVSSKSGLSQTLAARLARAGCWGLSEAQFHVWRLQQGIDKCQALAGSTVLAALTVAHSQVCRRKV